MIALSVATLKAFSPESKISLLIHVKPKVKKNFEKKKRETLDEFQRLEVRGKARNVFVMSLFLSDHKVLHNVSFDFALSFSLFFARISYFKIFGVKWI